MLNVKRQHPTDQTNFRTLASFKRFAKKYGCTVKLVTKGKKNSYYQMCKDGAIVGYFNTQFGGMAR